MERQLTCPECGSDSVQKAKVLHESGTSTSLSKMSIGVGTGSNVGVAEGRGRSQAELAKQFSPPVKPSIGLMSGTVTSLIVGGIMCLIILAVYDIWHRNPRAIGGFVIVSVLIIISSIFLIKFVSKELNQKKTKYQEDCDKWDRLWFCNRCGHTFYIE